MNDKPLPEVLPCPACKKPCGVYYTDAYESGDKLEHYQVHCMGANTTKDYGCGYSGPYCLSEADAISIHNSVCGSVAGWKLVPIEPTEAMMKAWYIAWERARANAANDFTPIFTRAYEAMLAAVPAPPGGRK